MLCRRLRARCGRATALRRVQFTTLVVVATTAARRAALVRVSGWSRRRRRCERTLSHRRRSNDDDENDARPPLPTVRPADDDARANGPDSPPPDGPPTTTLTHPADRRRCSLPRGHGHLPRGAAPAEPEAAERAHGLPHALRRDPLPQAAARRGRDRRRRPDGHQALGRLEQGTVEQPPRGS